jgi:hypothetical protein
VNEALTRNRSGLFSCLDWANGGVPFLHWFGWPGVGVCLKALVVAESMDLAVDYCVMVPSCADGHFEQDTTGLSQLNVSTMRIL